MGIIGKSDSELLTWIVALPAPAQGTAVSLWHPGEQEMVLGMFRSCWIDPTGPRLSPGLL